MAKSSSIRNLTATLTNKVNFPGDDGTPTITQDEDDLSGFEDYIDPVYGNMDFSYTINWSFQIEDGDDTPIDPYVENLSVEIISTSPDVTDPKYPHPVEDIGIIDFAFNSGTGTRGMETINAVKNNVEPFPGQSYRVLKTYEDLGNGFTTTISDEPVVDDQTDIVNFTSKDLVRFYSLITQEMIEELESDFDSYTAELAAGQDIDDGETEAEWLERKERLENLLATFKTKGGDFDNEYYNSLVGTSGIISDLEAEPDVVLDIDYFIPPQTQTTENINEFNERFAPMSDADYNFYTVQFNQEKDELRKEIMLGDARFALVYGQPSLEQHPDFLEGNVKEIPDVLNDPRYGGSNVLDILQNEYNLTVDDLQIPLIQNVLSALQESGYNSIEEYNANVDRLNAEAEASTVLTTYSENLTEEDNDVDEINQYLEEAGSEEKLEKGAKFYKKIPEDFGVSKDFDYPVWLTTREQLYERLLEMEEGPLPRERSIVPRVFGGEIPTGDKTYVRYSEQEVDDVENFASVCDWRQPDVKQFTIAIRVSGDYKTFPSQTSSVPFFFDLFQLIDWHYIPALNRLTDLVERSRI